MAKQQTTVRPSAADKAIIKPSFRLDFTTRDSVPANLEASLLAHPTLHHLSVLPPPTISAVSVEMFSLTPPSAKADNYNTIPWPPTPLERREAFNLAVRAYSGCFINGVQVPTAFIAEEVDNAEVS